MPRPRSRHAFSLVELLVVVTLIVVLLALIAPAMDQAIYQAELTVCGTRLKSLGTAAIEYSGANRRFYPRRNVVESSAAQPSRLLSALPAASAATTYDDRRMLQGYVTLDNYLDPLVREVDLSLSHDDTHLFVGYSIWFGFRYKNLGYKGMKKLGDRLQWIAVADADKTPRYFNVLASDIDFVRSTSSAASAPTVYSGHPDAAELLWQSVNLNIEYTPMGLNGKQTNAWWMNRGANMRGPVDLNYAYDDGSVLRLGAVEWNEWEERDRMVRVAEYSTLTSEHPDYNQLPR